MLALDARAAKVTWTVALTALALYGLYEIRSTFLIAIFAVFFAYLVYPLVALVDKYTRHRLPRTVLLGIVFAMIVAVALTSAMLMGGRVVDEATRLSDQLPTLLDTKTLSQRIPLPSFLEPWRDRLIKFAVDQLKSGTDQALPFAQKVGKVFFHAATNLVYLVLVPLLSFLLIKEAASLQQSLYRFVGGAQRAAWVETVEAVNLLMSSYVRTLLLLSIATFSIYAIFLSLIGAPYAVLLAVLAALLEVIPVIGPLVAFGVILIASLVGGFQHLLWVAGFIGAYRMFQDYVLAPFLMGRGVEISSLMVIVGLLAGEQIGGVAGIFLSVPVIALLKILWTQLQSRGVEGKIDQNLPIVAEG